MIRATTDRGKIPGLTPKNGPGGGFGPPMAFGRDGEVMLRSIAGYFLQMSGVNISYRPSQTRLNHETNSGF